MATSSTYHLVGPASLEEDFAPEETSHAPLFGFAAGTVISLWLWACFAVAVWVVVR
jgi:hypothetical protein